MDRRDRALPHDFTLITAMNAKRRCRWCVRRLSTSREAVPHGPVARLRFRSISVLTSSGG
jgi:hypothetical protein